MHYASMNLREIINTILIHPDLRIGGVPPPRGGDCRWSPSPCATHSRKYSIDIYIYCLLYKLYNVDLIEYIIDVV